MSITNRSWILQSKALQILASATELTEFDLLWLYLVNVLTREILTHHYIDIDAEVIFNICNEKLEELESYILSIQ